MKITNPFLLYISTYLLSLIFDWLALILICSNFDRKSAMCIYLYGIGGFIVKGLVFFLPLLLFYKKSWLHSAVIRTIIFFFPFLIFLTWFATIIIFEIEYLYLDLSFGYIYHFPHFIIQLLSSFVVPLCILVMVSIKLRRQKANN